MQPDTPQAPVQVPPIDVANLKPPAFADHPPAGSTAAGVGDRPSNVLPDGNSDAALFDRLRALKHACGPQSNKNEIATILILACLAEGIHAGRRIVGVLVHLGLNKRHAGAILDKGAGKDSARHSWQRDDEGRYVVLE